MQDSYSELILPFSSSKELFEQYTNATGGIRTGKLMEHLDSMAGSIAYKHILGPVKTLGKLEDRGFYVVTASVDRLDMLAPLVPSRDLRLSGHVIYTGRSSMEIGLRMESIGGVKPDETVLIGRFSMVCRDNLTQKARQVNPLKISGPEERALFDLGETIKQRRQTQASISLGKVPPDSSEAAALHSFYLQHGEGHQDASPTLKDHVFMGDTIQERCMLMFPQERNVHGKIFGGYLMRLAYELGFTNANMFTRGPLRFLSSDGISFAHPVPIGSILRLRSQILHTSSSADYPIIVHVGVRANVVDVKTGEEQTTNEFRFTWSQEFGKHSQNLRTVVPKTYKEAMLWLEGKRALALGAEIRGSRMNE
ncbi:HotDog domain-containing protein [Crepidotus variabilis]|uniref:HotDog domain-containing protein n=1 Tax=Crepidotus variabilis TaxID=179855 RepID=A0A9P6JQC2_9AGAR|nr:HotDog domain-containing protein [Crepidotus variabilis]